MKTQKFNFNYPVIIGRIIRTITVSISSAILLSLTTVLFRFRFIFHSNDLIDSFYSSLEFLVTTITTLGYGKPLIPVVYVPMIVTLFYQIFGILVYSYIYQKIVVFVQKTRTYQDMRNERFDLLDKWLYNRERFFREVNLRTIFLLLKIKHGFRFIWRQNVRDLYGGTLLRKLSPVLAEKVSEEGTRTIINQFKLFFIHFEPELAKAIVKKLQPVM